jgi:hypothetical protein
MNNAEVLILVLQGCTASRAAQVHKLQWLAHASQLLLLPCVQSATAAAEVMHVATPRYAKEDMRKERICAAPKAHLVLIPRP